MTEFMDDLHRHQSQSKKSQALPIEKVHKRGRKYVPTATQQIATKQTKTANDRRKSAAKYPLKQRIGFIQKDVGVDQRDTDKKVVMQQPGPNRFFLLSVNLFKAPSRANTVGSEYCL